jgi:hypothetical protein
MVLETAGGHSRNPNGILGLLCREHFPGLVEYAGVTSPAYTFDHYAVTPDAVDRDDRQFNNKVERVKLELWVSLPRTILFNKSHLLHILEIIMDTSSLYVGFLQVRCWIRGQGGCGVYDVL